MSDHPRTFCIKGFTIKASILNGIQIFIFDYIEAVAQRCSIKKVFFKNFAKFTGKHLCQSQVSACNFIKKETLVQVFSCEVCEIFKNTFLIEYLRWLLLILQHSLHKKWRFQFLADLVIFTEEILNEKLQFLPKFCHLTLREMCPC